MGRSWPERAQSGSAGPQGGRDARGQEASAISRLGYADGGFDRCHQCSHDVGGQPPGAPLIALDPTADITDFYFFRSWEPGKADRVVFIMNVIPQQAPASGPNFYNFDDDGDGDAKDPSHEFRFATEIRPPFNDPLVSFFGGAAGIPPITALDGTGSEGLSLRQCYTVTEVRGQQRTDLGTGALFAVPSNVGPCTMPDYEALAAQGIYSLTNGGRVLAGQHEETFYIDLGSTFDSLNFRRDPPLLTDAEDADDTRNPFGVDNGFEGLNVNTIAIEVPISAVTDNRRAVLGAYASTSRPASLCHSRRMCWPPLSRRSGNLPVVPPTKRCGNGSSKSTI